jgi:hypothetical protein
MVVYWQVPTTCGYSPAANAIRLFSCIGHKFIDAVTAADIRELMLIIEGRNARDVAKRSHETIGQIFRYAIARGIASRNPAADFKPSDILAEYKPKILLAWMPKNCPAC